MVKLEDTLSVCEHCYRHVPAVRFLQDNQIWLGKTCKHHGYSEHLVEPDGEFYLEYKYPRHALGSYLIDITNRCNLNCPNCYQEPDNISKDLPIDYYLNIVKSWPDDGYPLALCGAEPTVRKDLPEFVEALNNLPGKRRNIMILTNGVRLSEYDYTEQFKDFDNVMWTIGLNHPDYQGRTVRQKQMEGIANCKELGLKIKNVSYTLETLDQMEYCMEEIQEFGLSICQQYRIRCGADIGRYPGGPKIFLSDLVKEARRIAEKNNWSVSVDPGAGNRAHYPLIVNGILIKIIQWPDAKTLDLSEVQTEAIADIIPGKPRSPLVHQVILRDALVNKNLNLWDTIPKEYVENYGHIRN
jgi:organic radical activating enzyme